MTLPRYSAPILRLASSSPRRIELLGALGVDFEAVEPGVDELGHADPALAKAEAGAAAGHVTVGADTLVLLDGDVLGKPRDADDARAMLRRLAGREHVLRTTVAVISAAGRRLRFAVRTRLWTRDLDDERIDRYVATGEPLGKAGAYAIQGAGAELIASYEGCYSNVLGLPLCHTYFALRHAGVATRELPEPAFERHFGFTCPAHRCAYLQGRAIRDGAEYESWRERA